MTQVLVDTGPLVAILSASDQHHESCVQQLKRIKGRLLTSWPVLTEAAWLLRSYPAALSTLLSSFQSGPLCLAALNESDMPAIAAILTRYKTLEIQLADASLLHLANREGIDTVFTLDRRDFSVLRLSGKKKLRLIP